MRIPAPFLLSIGLSLFSKFHPTAAAAAGKTFAYLTGHAAKAAPRMALAAGSLVAVAACGQPSPYIDARRVGDPDHGRALIQYYGCGSCHTIPGVPGADALVGPPLSHFARRLYVAGVLRNVPDDLVLWIRNPQKVVPGNAMPVMGIDEHDARDIAAYLYTIE